MSVAALLLLADARFPDGTHAHSFGLEAAVAAGRVRSPSTLSDYIEARLWTSGLTECAAASLAARADEPLDRIDAELTLRTPGAPARATSRALGRSLLRTADRLWPDRPIPRAPGRPPMQPVAFGAVATLAGCTPEEAALGTAHGLAGTMATAALRLLGMDPFAVASVLTSMRSTVADVANSAADVRSAADLPDSSTPFAEIDPDIQHDQELRLFGS